MSTIRNWLLPAALLALFLMLNACAPGGDKEEAGREGAGAGHSGQMAKAESEPDHAEADEPAAHASESVPEEGHGEPGIGYIGLETREPVPE